MTVDVYLYLDLVECSSTAVPQATTLLPAAATCGRSHVSSFPWAPWAPTSRRPRTSNFWRATTTRSCRAKQISTCSTARRGCVLVHPAKKDVASPSVPKVIAWWPPIINARQLPPHDLPRGLLCMTENGGPAYPPELQPPGAIHSDRIRASLRAVLTWPSLSGSIGTVLLRQRVCCVVAVFARGPGALGGVQGSRALHRRRTVCERTPDGRCPALIETDGPRS